MSQGFAYAQELIALDGNYAVNNFAIKPTVVPSTETLVVSYTVPVGKTALIKGVYGEGGTDGLFKLYVNTVAVWQGRNAWTQRLVQTPLERTVATGDIVELKVTNLKALNHMFSGGFYVYEL
jgi:hypothetical protein